MWTCPKCNRVFEKTAQPHSCHKIPLDEHFINKQSAKVIFDFLVSKVSEEVGLCQIISIPCCIHLFGEYDFLAALPKKNALEIRFSLDRKIKSLRLKTCVPMSAKVFKNCFDITKKEEIDTEFIKWLKQSYYLKDKNASEINV